MKKNKGFSLIELMIVVAIIGILSLMAVPSYNNYVKRAYFARVFQSLNTATDEWREALATGEMAALWEKSFVDVGIPKIPIPTFNHIYDLHGDNRPGNSGYQGYSNKVLYFSLVSDNIYNLLAGVPDSVFYKAKNQYDWKTSLSVRAVQNLSLETNYPYKAEGFIVSIIDHNMNIYLNIIASENGEKFCTYGGYDGDTGIASMPAYNYFPKNCELTADSKIIPQFL